MFHCNELPVDSLLNHFTYLRTGLQLFTTAGKMRCSKTYEESTYTKRTLASA